MASPGSRRSRKSTRPISSARASPGCRRWPSRRRPARRCGPDARGRGGAAVLDQPARALGHEEHQEEEEQGRDGLGAEHPAPAGLAVPGGENLGGRGARRHGLGDQPVDDLGQQDADDDGQLIDRDEPAADLGRRDLGDVHRREVRGQADADPADDAEDDEDGEVRGQAVPTAETVNMNAGEDQQPLAAEPVAQPARRPVRRRGSRPGRTSWPSRSPTASVRPKNFS